MCGEERGHRLARDRALDIAYAHQISLGNLLCKPRVLRPRANGSKRHAASAMYVRSLDNVEKKRNVLLRHEAAREENLQWRGRSGAREPLECFEIRGQHGFEEHLVPVPLL